ncbi:MAG: hypothetical protein ABR956_07505 [Terracidiphilus sp.]|jgi:hypothetical protein
MIHEFNTSSDSLIPPKPIPAEAHAFSKQFHGLLDGRPKDDETVAEAFEGMDGVFDMIAAGLYNMASMLAGEGEQSVRLVEAAIANAEVSTCHDPAQARKNSRRALCAAALETLAGREQDCLAAPLEGLEPTGTCIEDDDLAAAGVSSEELERMLAGPERDRVRSWLAGLPTKLRTIFVLRAVAGFSTAETARMLARHGGPRAARWSGEAVSGLFRQGLCSLASQLLHATAGR